MDAKEKPQKSNKLNVGAGQDSTEHMAIVVSRILDTLHYIKKLPERTPKEKKRMKEYSEEETRDLFGS